MVDPSTSDFSVATDFVRGVQGHFVLALGADDAGAQALAIWQVSATGRGVGAWILRHELIRSDSGRLCRVMELMRDRCLVGWTEESAMSVLEEVAGVLPVSMVGAMQRHIIAIPDLLDEIRQQRVSLLAAVEEYRGTTRSKVVPLEWPTEIPSDDDFVALARRRKGVSPVATDALAQVSAIARAAQFWQDTEQARYRRRYLRARGEQQPLPPRWLMRLREAAGDATHASEPEPAGTDDLERVAVDANT